MSGVVAWGIGMMVAGKVAENQDWGSEKFQKGLMIGGAAVATGMFGGDGLIWGEAGAASELGAASEVGAQTAPLQATPPIEGTVLSASEGSLAADVATDAATDGVLSAASEPAAAEGLLSSAPAPAAANSAAIAPGEYTAAQLAEKGITVEQAAGMSTSQLAAVMMGGNILSSAYSAKAQEEQDEKEWGRQSAYGVRNDGRGGVSSLNVGSRFNQINNRMNTRPGNNTNFTQRENGLLS